jgi:hypothetical protein
MTADTPNNSRPIYPGTPEPNVQDGRLLGEGDPAEAGVIATGDRREQVHFEPDPKQMVVARHLVKPKAPLPPQEQTPGAAAADADAPPIEDVAVAPDEPSVWDARPRDGEPEKSGDPPGP